MFGSLENVIGKVSASFAVKKSCGLCRCTGWFVLRWNVSGFHHSMECHSPTIPSVPNANSRNEWVRRLLLTSLPPCPTMWTRESRTLVSIICSSFPLYLFYCLLVSIICSSSPLCLLLLSVSVICSSFSLYLFTAFCYTFLLHPLFWPGWLRTCE